MTDHNPDQFSVFKPISRSLLRLIFGPVLALLYGCTGIQSTFSAFGVEAESTRSLTWVMTAAATVITIGVLWLAWYAARTPASQLDYKGGMRVIFWFGALGPTLLLSVLLVFSLSKMRTLPTGTDDLKIAVTGEQFWWRARYLPVGGQSVETANEIRIPVGRTVAFALTSPDVIHSFWIPGLAGKVDMIPGRTNDLVVRATQAGVYRGVCAEFCGLSHAHMAFDVVAMEPAAFEQWLTNMAHPATGGDSPGRKLFESYGCSGCHTIRGHIEGATIGPDLTHFGSRLSVGAGTLPMTLDAISRFIRNPASVKPGVMMPDFREISDKDVAVISNYLVELR
ncbi:MAG: cytochrome c oxidase subunit II [Methylovulum sp.]|nr:cytochrome c oxidase subunit II [Methylovulum sp.]